MPSRSVGTVVTTTYLYDVNDERIEEGANSATTTYPFTIYNVATSSGRATYTKQIFANGEPVADVQGSTTTAKVYYIHDDALGGANVLSNASGTVQEVIEYYPFGGIRLNQQAASFGEQRRFTGHEFDAGTGLNYMDARYEGPNLARFLSEEPYFLAIGSAEFAKQYPSAALIQKSYSPADPHDLNSYSYANNNPLASRDPDGKAGIPPLYAIALGLLGGVQNTMELYQERSANAAGNGQTYNLWKDNGGDYGRAFGVGALTTAGCESYGCNPSQYGAAQAVLGSFADRFETGNWNFEKNALAAAKTAAARRVINGASFNITTPGTLPSASLTSVLTSVHFANQTANAVVEFMTGGAINSLSYSLAGLSALSAFVPSISARAPFSGITTDGSYARMR